MGINILLWEEMGMFLYTTKGWDGNGNTVMRMGGNGIEEVISAHLYILPKVAARDRLASAKSEPRFP